ncbi:MAG: signal recognition particle protein Srp19 [Thermoprotei archaeon]|nr:MAG: signal recognition particle protein Srp19 [Thermoprotei archaeon]
MEYHVAGGWLNLKRVSSWSRVGSRLGEEPRRVVLWPLYFDARRSREEGRRVPKHLAVEGPSAEEVARAARAAGYQVEVDLEARHPSTWFEGRGRVFVLTDEPKTAVIRKVAVKLRQLRSSRASS